MTRAGAALWYHFGPAVHKFPTTMSIGQVVRYVAIFWLCSVAPGVLAHGSVTSDDDLCLITIGFYQAHFTVFQPRTRAHEEYCEDLPDVTETVFVMDYLHDSMREVPVDFRIIRDRHQLGRFVQWEDVAELTEAELAEDTVVYEPPATKVDAVFAVLHTFDDPGHYIGVVTAEHPDLDRLYTAVFPFEVGATGWGYAPAIVALLVGAQLAYWFLGGGYGRWQERRA